MYWLILSTIILPLLAAVVVIFATKRNRVVGEMSTLVATLATLGAAIALFGKGGEFSAPATALGMSFSLRLYHFSGFILLASAGFGVLLALYSIIFMRGRNYLGQYYCYFLLTLGFTNGAVLSNNLILMLFFWEGLLLSLFGMIVIGNGQALKTATKAFVIVGVTDLCLMIGIALTGYLAHTMTMSYINLPLEGLACVAFILMMIGAISKAGAMPFHTWIPDAAIDAPLPFMAFVPAALEKLLGIYLLARISLDLFILTPESWVSVVLMVVGAITILLAVMMALIQKDYKRLLSYHAISQVGYMILGIGTAVPAGIVGGIFHMINHALYKSGLFLSGGSVEKQAGTTDLEQLGGIGAKMPITFACFFITACAISGVPPFNGFFSKELVYDGALERGWVYYAAALLGSFLTAASFLKLGHAAFLGKLADKNKDVKESSWPMLIPMITIAAFCVFFGVCNFVPLNYLIQPVLGEAKLEGHHFAGWPSSVALVLLTVVTLAAAFLNHWLGFKSKGSGIKAVDHIHYAPGLAQIYDMAEKRFFDPYDLGLKAMDAFVKFLFWCDRAVDWVYDGLTVKVTQAFTGQIRRVHTGNYSAYVSWSLVAMVFVVFFLLAAK